MANMHLTGQMDVRETPGGPVLSRVDATLVFLPLNQNTPPQYTGPSVISDLIVGVGRQLQGVDANGDPITWSVPAAHASKISITPGGVLTALVPLTNSVVQVVLDDGRV